MPDYDDALVDAVAKALYLHEYGSAYSWRTAADSYRYRDEARAAIAAVLEWQGKNIPPATFTVRQEPDGRVVIESPTRQTMTHP